MRHLFLLLLLTPLLSFGQISLNHAVGFVENYPNGQIQHKGKKVDQLLVDTLYSYYTNGDLWTIQIFPYEHYPRTLYYYENLKKMAAKKREGYFIQTDDTTYIRDGDWKYYYKNGIIMDSIIYKNGKQIYRARFNKKGKFQFDK